MRVAIVGSRTVPENICEIIMSYIPAETLYIVSGGCNGVDKAAEQIAKSLSIPIQIFLPDYGTYGRGATLIRNKLIVENCDLLLAFWDGYSNGTAYTIAECIKNDKSMRVIPIGDVCGEITRQKSCDGHCDKVKG